MCERVCGGVYIWAGVCVCERVCVGVYMYGQV